MLNINKRTQIEYVENTQFAGVFSLNFIFLKVWLLRLLRFLKNKKMIIAPPSIGILAYGSLINDPGPELLPHVIRRIDTITPFNVEFMRQSASRGNAPTLIPVEARGRPVRATILVLDNNITIEQARNFLWRRELHITDQTRVYVEPQRPTVNNVLIRDLRNFLGLDTILYTQIGQNIPDPVTPDVLARLAVNSVSTSGGQNGNDGISYLLNAKNNGIVTELSDAYEQAILQFTNTSSLEQALEVTRNRSL